MNIITIKLKHVVNVFTYYTEQIIKNLEKCAISHTKIVTHCKNVLVLVYLNMTLDSIDKL